MAWHRAATLLMSQGRKCGRVP